MDLISFLKVEGHEAVARKVGVSKQIVYEWANLNKAPRPENVLKLILISNGRLTWESIYLPFAQKALHGTSFVMDAGSFSSKVSFDFKKELKELGHTI